MEEIRNGDSILLNDADNINEETSLVPKIWEKFVDDTDTHLQLSPIRLDEDYCKTWNIHHHDFVCLTKNGKLVDNTLYRVGSSSPNLKKDNYFLLIKYTEVYHAKDDLFRTNTDSPRYLKNQWCIIDKNGIEKADFDGFTRPYLIPDSCIYSINGNYCNLETGEFYCNANSTMESSNYLFLENKYDRDVSNRGIMKVNKKNGSWILFP